jgi:hypothetical protein
MKCCILLITYKRPTFLPRLFAAVSESNLPLFIYQNASPLLSLDKSHNLVSQLISRHIRDYPQSIYFSPPHHLSIGHSITYAISYVSKLSFDYTLVLEDDINLELSFANLHSYFDLLHRYECSASLSFHTPFEDSVSHAFFLSPLFHSWGYILRNSIWRQYIFADKQLDKTFFLQIHNRTIPLCVRAYYALAYLSEVGIVSTWDYQWSAYCLYYGYSHILLHHSLSSHLGHDKFSTHDHTVPDQLQLHEVRMTLLDSTDNIYRLDSCDLLFTRHHKLNHFKSFLLVFLASLPLSFSRIIVQIYRIFRL